MANGEQLRTTEENCGQQNQQLRITEEITAYAKGMTIEVIREAVARGWCHDANKHKVMDTYLAEAIAQEVHRLILEDKTPYLGCATTRGLIAELKARCDMARHKKEEWPKYRTIDNI